MVAKHLWSDDDDEGDKKALYSPLLLLHLIKNYQQVSYLVIFDIEQRRKVYKPCRKIKVTLIHSCSQAIRCDLQQPHGSSKRSHGWFCL